MLTIHPNCKLSLFVSYSPPFPVHNQGHLRNLIIFTAYIWSKCIKKYFRIIHKIISTIRSDLIFFFHLSLYCFYLSCTAMCDNQLQKIVYEIALCCAMFYVTWGVYLYIIESIKRMWNSWEIIRASNSTIWHLTLRIDSQGYTKYKGFFVLFIFVFRNPWEQTAVNAEHISF